MYGCMALQLSEAGVLVLQGISNSRAIVHHLQHLQGLDKDDRWQFAVLYLCFVDIGSILNKFPSFGDTLVSTPKISKMYCMSDTAAVVVGYCHTCFILVANLQSPSSLRVFQDFLHQPSYLGFSTCQMRTEELGKPQKLTSGLPKRNRTQVQNCWD